MKRFLLIAAMVLSATAAFAQTPTATISVDRNRYCTDLGKWTSVAKAQVAARNDAKAMDPYKCGPVPVTPPPPPPPPPPVPTPATIFTSNWDNTSGTLPAAVNDGGKWTHYDEYNGGTNVQLLSVVAGGGPNGHNALKVVQRGSAYAANLQLDNVVGPSKDYYLRYYMRNDDTSSAGDHIVTVDTLQYPNLTFMRKTSGPNGWTFVSSFYGCGYTYPIGHWGPTKVLTRGAWYRFEYFVHFVDPTHVQVHPRVYDASNNLILSETDFNQSDPGSAVWNGKSNWTLGSYYAAGNNFCVDPQYVNDIGVGNNGQQDATDTGLAWYFASLEVRTDTWPGPVANGTQTPAPIPVPTPNPAPVPDPTPVPVPPSNDTAIYISPTGSDALTSTGSRTLPYKTFSKAFGALRSGGELVLLDGTFPNTSCINYQGANDGMPPSGTAAAPTYVHALNPGKVLVDCQLFVGRTSNKASYIIFDGISFDGHDRSAAAVYNSDHVIIRNGGFHSLVNDGGGVFDVGTNDGNWGNTNDLFEDLWIWGKARAIADNYRANNNTWRRVVLRGDGCSSSDCAGSGNPNIGFTVYDSAHVTTENVVIMDRQLVGSGNQYSDFAVAQHTAGLAGGDNMWLGTISKNAPDVGYYFEPDQQTINPSNTIINGVAYNSTEDGISIARSGQTILQNITVKPRNGTAIYFGDGLAAGSKATTVLALAGSIGSKVSITGLSTSDPAMVSPLKSALGATIEFQYKDRVLTTIPLFPWPNEARIKAEMCSVGPRGFCNDTLGLSHYLKSF